MNKIAVVALSIVVLLSGCVTERVIYQGPAPAAYYAPTVFQPACPFGTAPAYWHNPDLGYTQMVCASVNTVYVRDSSSLFGWGVVTGVTAAIILRSLGRSGHHHRR
jgi:hypothetical protein